VDEMIIEILSYHHRHKQTASMRFAYWQCTLSFLLIVQSLPAQIISDITLFPETTFVQSFPADAHAHRMNVENILFSKDLRASMGAQIPVFEINLIGTTSQGSLGASVHFELHPVGQAQIVSNDYYIDFLILDISMFKDHFGRFVIGHTSHHLSDNWYERLQFATSVRYSRDYVKLVYIYNKENENLFYFGVDYGYIFTIGQKLSKPWTFQTGGEVPLLKVFESIQLYAAVDTKIRQESGFAATNTLQFGAKMPMRQFQNIRLAYQYRFGLDERGQFFPQHRRLHTIGLYINV
jgi:hypothetical protein